MIEFDVGNRCYFKADDLTRMCGECIGRDYDDAETLYCTKKDKSYASNARRVAK